MVYIYLKTLVDGNEFTVIMEEYPVKDIIQIFLEAFAMKNHAQVIHCDRGDIDLGLYDSFMK
jgi:hypothetical protein